MEQARCGSGRAGKRLRGYETACGHIQVLLHLLRLLVRLVGKHSASAIYATDQRGAGTGRRIDLKQGLRIWVLAEAGLAEQRTQWAFPLSVLSGHARWVQARVYGFTISAHLCWVARIMSWCRWEATRRRLPMVRRSSRVRRTVEASASSSLWAWLWMVSATGTVGAPLLSAAPVAAEDMGIGAGGAHAWWWWPSRPEVLRATWTGEREAIIRSVPWGLQAWSKRKWHESPRLVVSRIPDAGVQIWDGPFGQSHPQVQT